nr:MAG TPA: hypothetical protein [Caudoviricetes sp.]
MAIVFYFCTFAGDIVLLFVSLKIGYNDGYT